MANGFDSVGAGAARGLTTGLQLGAQRRQQRAQQMSAQGEALRTELENSEKLALETTKYILDVATKAAETQPLTPERLAPIRQGYEAAVASYGTLLEDLKQRAIISGAPPDMIAAITAKQQGFVDSQRVRFEAFQEAQSLFARRTERASSNFFANVEGIGEARVTSIPQADGSFKFFVGEQEVPADRIDTTVQRQQQVEGPLQIPGLTESQSGQVIGKLREQAAATNTFTEIANQVIKDIGNEPEKIGAIGAVLRGASSISAQAQALARITGIPIFEGSIDQFDFGTMAGESREVKTRLLDLVFLNLTAKGQTGHSVSNADLKIFMDATGLGTGDPGQVRAGLESAVLDNQRALKNNIMTQGGGKVGIADIIPDGLSEFEAITLSDDEAEELLKRAQEAIDAGNFEEARKLMDQARGGN